MENIQEDQKGLKVVVNQNEHVSMGMYFIMINEHILIGSRKH